MGRDVAEAAALALAVGACVLLGSRLLAALASALCAATAVAR